MGGVLRAEPLWVEIFTSLRMRQFERLLKVVRNGAAAGPLPVGRAACRRSPSTAARTSPCGSSRLSSTSRRRRSAGSSSGCGRSWPSSLPPILLRATPPMRGLGESGLAGRCASVTVLADGASIDTGLVVPQRKRPGRALLLGEEEDNAEPQSQGSLRRRRRPLPPGHHRRYLGRGARRTLRRRRQGSPPTPCAAREPDPRPLRHGGRYPGAEVTFSLQRELGSTGPRWTGSCET